ncbi:EthD domain-containing protein [Dactylonectria macrodidyma]|uniref:EthD domain-containing protein n=1 Tax=Dactylonectria macrodidyma TaxID=307937 RepID=A0A9P9EP93_9HYPO|nr:EthD domain-containing protein [Dactylonectria macrodidyma]
MAGITTLYLIGTALFGASRASEHSKSNTGLVQMITYVKRRPGSTRDEFWKYWETQHAPKVDPLATHFNITRYQQVQVGGKILPTEAGASAPASQKLVEFDGIAMFLYESADVLTAMLSHPYYTEVVEPDEHVFIDKNAFGGGMVATFIGNHIEAVDRGRDVWIGDKVTRRKYQKLFDSYL